jgi:dipeptidyl aminopeptidase/acylaminoacyl peptidase
MPRHLMRPNDLNLVRWADDPHLSPDGARVIWCETSLDADRDEPVSCLMVAPTDASAPPRRFTEGPHDFSPRWSPDGRYIAYLSASDGPPSLRLAPLDGGVPITVPTPGAVSWISWSPSGDRLVLVSNVPARQSTAEPTPKERNAPRIIRGLNNRLDGQGWHEGRDHLFVYGVGARALRQVTSGEFDHSMPAWSPDGSSLLFAADRSRRRDERKFRADLWTIPAAGGRPRQVTTDIGAVCFPSFSPEGRRVAFIGLPGAEQMAARDSHLFVVDLDGDAGPERVAPGVDRPVGFSWATLPYLWLSPDELLFTVADAAAVGLRRARLGDRRARVVLGGELQVSGFSVAGTGSGQRLAYSAAWVDAPAEVSCRDLAGRKSAPVQVSRAGADLLRSVELLPTERLTASAPDGLAIEYFVIRPKRGRGAAPHPVFLEIHGGPNLFNPIALAFTHYQALAAAGYVVVMPNPRGSNSYGERFTKAVRKDWGGADFGDLMACVDDAIDRDLADPDRQFVGGYSYGGFMTSWVVGHTKRFRAACVGAPIVDHVSMFGTTDSPWFLADSLGCDPWDEPSEYAYRSPLTYAPNVETPVLLYVNEGDLRCPAGQAYELYAALKWLGKKVEFALYPGGSHVAFFPMVGAPSQNEDRLRRILGWLARYGGVPIE